MRPTNRDIFNEIARVFDDYPTRRIYEHKSIQEWNHLALKQRETADEFSYHAYEDGGLDRDDELRDFAEKCGLNLRCRFNGY